MKSPDLALQERVECLLIAQEAERFYDEEAALMTHIQAIEHCQGASKAAWDIALRIKARDLNSEEARILRESPQRVILDDSAKDGYVNLCFTPREAKVVEMILTDTLTTEIADHFNMTVERVNQITQRAKRKTEYAFEKYVKRVQEAANKPCAVRSQEGEE